jgi:hypothetical protein
MRLETELIISEESPTSYFVVTEAYPLIGLKGKYLVHAEGNRRTLFKLWRENVNAFGPTTYFMLKKFNYFKNHATPVEGYDGLYIYKE